MTNQEPKPSPAIYGNRQAPFHLGETIEVLDEKRYPVLDANGKKVILTRFEDKARLFAQAPETAELLRELAGACWHMKHDLQTKGGQAELMGMQLAEAIYELWLVPILAKIEKLEGK